MNTNKSLANYLRLTSLASINLYYSEFLIGNNQNESNFIYRQLQLYGHPYRHLSALPLKKQRCTRKFPRGSEKIINSSEIETHVCLHHVLFSSYLIMIHALTSSYNLFKYNLKLNFVFFDLASR